MTISYKWLCEYLPVSIEPERLSKILTSIGLEVEKMETFEEIKGGLKGLVIGEVLMAEKHPNADKLKLTRVNIGNGETLNIVCGAPNVAAGQKVIVAPVGATIYPSTGEPLTMRIAKIRGEESHGMICAEDEIGMGSSHEGIMVLPKEASIGSRASDYFKPYSDIIFGIGLTPNRMDAMSHWGVARDVCAYLSHHDKKELRPVLPASNFKPGKPTLDITITVEAPQECPRYSGICISNVRVAPSPLWLQQRLKSIGVRPINNIVDITNFIQHETGQPLHAFDYDELYQHTIVVKKLAEGTPFITLDEKQRKLSNEDLMICDGKQPICIAGVFGGMESGVTEKTTNLFLESACFDAASIRKTSFRHGLRTDAATRFEKGIDISQTVAVLKRAVMMICEIAGGTIASELKDIYPEPLPRKEIALKYQYLKKLSGKNYHPDTVKNILHSLGFQVVREGMDTMTIEVPFHKPDVALPADIVEEVLRIDGLDNIDIPHTISISPSIEENTKDEILREKISNVLTGLGFSEILTNSITNSAFYTASELENSVRLLNNLSSELDILRPSMLHTALEVIAFNVNRKNSRLKFFEFGKTYSAAGTGKYIETNHLCFYITGEITDQHWKSKATPSDIFYAKGIAEALLANLGFNHRSMETSGSIDLDPYLTSQHEGEKIVEIGKVKQALLSRFDIKQPVFFGNIYWDIIVKNTSGKIQFNEISKYPSVERDLAMIVPISMKFNEIQERIKKLKLDKLNEIKLFDVFESEKLGVDKKSLAINFTFTDEEKTLTDKEIESLMQKIMTTLEKDLKAEIRK